MIFIIKVKTQQTIIIKNFYKKLATIHCQLSSPRFVSSQSEIWFLPLALCLYKQNNKVSSVWCKFEFLVWGFFSSQIFIQYLKHLGVPVKDGRENYVRKFRYSNILLLYRTCVSIFFVINKKGFLRQSLTHNSLTVFFIYIFLSPTAKI